MRLVLLLAALVFALSCAAQTYEVRIARVLDGDTVKAHIVVWDGIVVNATIRLAGVNAPELKAKAACERKAGQEAKAFTERFLAAGKVKFHMEGREKFGRSLGRLEVDGKDLGAELVRVGLAKPYRGERRGPWCAD